VKGAQGHRKQILMDARECVPGRLTGIGRVLLGLADALSEVDWIGEIILAGASLDAVPPKLMAKGNITFSALPSSFFFSELALTRLANKSVDLLISPYPKLPLFGFNCPAAHFIHDILDLTHPAYRPRAKRYFDTWRLRKALEKADLTWYDSEWSRKETLRYTGLTGRNPKVRHLGIGANFKDRKDQDPWVTGRHALEPGYILVLGNGKPHKNLGVLLEQTSRLKRPLVLVGVSDQYRRFWISRYPESKAAWIGQVSEKDLPFILGNAFCLAQPSTAEGYGYPPLEAMAVGVPCVVSDIEVLVETTGGNALVADPQDGPSWLKAFELLEDEGVYQRQVEKGRRWVEPLLGRAGWEGHISDIMTLIGGI